MPTMLSRDVQNKLVHFLVNYLEDPNYRETLLTRAFSGTKAVAYLDLSGASGQFTPRLVNHLQKFGFADGTPALLRLLETFNEDIEHPDFDVLLAEVRRFYTYSAMAYREGENEPKRSTSTEHQVPTSPPDPTTHDEGSGEVAEAHVPAQSAAVMTVEIVSYTTLPARQQSRVFKAFTKVLSNVVRQVRSQMPMYSSLAGDRISLTLFSLDNALDIALQLADSVRSLPNQTYRVRIGLHAGMVYISRDEEKSHNVWGPGVQVAKYVMDLAEPDQILASLDFCRELDLLNGGPPPVDGLAVTPIGERLLRTGDALTVYNLALPGVGLSLQEDFDAWIATFNSPIERTVEQYKSLLEAYRNREKVRPNLHALQIAAIARRLLTLLPEVTAHGEEQSSHIANETIDEIWMAQENEGSIYYHFFLSNLQESLIYFLKVARLVRFRPGHPLFSEGELMDTLLFVVAGQVQISNRYGTNERRAGEGLIAGEWGLFTMETRHPVTIRAATEVIALVVHYDALDEHHHHQRIHGDIRTIRRLLWEKVYTRSVVREVLTTHELFRDLRPSELDGPLRSASFYPDSLDPSRPPTLELLERSWFVVVTGELRLTAKINSGGPFEIRYLPGDVVGLVHMSDYHFNDRSYMKYLMGLRIDEHTQLIRLSWRQIRRLLDENTPFYHQCIDRYNEVVATRWHYLLDEIPQAIND